MRKILIVEDDRFITAIFTMFIKDLGHELMDRASSGIEAIEMCKKDKPDVVLMDIHLEGELDGIQTSERLQREVGVPVIYISSDTSSDVIKRAVVSNSYGYLVKPINKQELGIAIDLAYYKYKIDQEQKEREQGYREFISESPTPIVLVRDDKFIYLNKASLNLFKTHYIEDVIGQPIANFICEENLEEVKQVISENIEDGKQVKPLCAQLKTVHGDSYWVKITGSKMMFNNKQTTQLVLNDISEVGMYADVVNVLQNSLFSESLKAFRLNADYSIENINKTFQSILNDSQIQNLSLESFLLNKEDLINAIESSIERNILKFNTELKLSDGSVVTGLIYIKRDFKCNVVSILFVESL